MPALAPEPPLEGGSVLGSCAGGVAGVHAANEEQKAATAANRTKYERMRVRLAASFAFVQAGANAAQQALGAERLLKEVHAFV